MSDDPCIYLPRYLFDMYQISNQNNNKIFISPVRPRNMISRYKLRLLSRSSWLREEGDPPLCACWWRSPSLTPLRLYTKYMTDADQGTVQTATTAACERRGRPTIRSLASRAALLDVSPGLDLRIFPSGERGSRFGVGECPERGVCSRFGRQQQDALSVPCSHMRLHVSLLLPRT